MKVRSDTPRRCAGRTPAVLAALGLRNPAGEGSFGVLRWCTRSLRKMCRSSKGCTGGVCQANASRAALPAVMSSSSASRGRKQRWQAGDSATSLGLEGRRRPSTGSAVRPGVLLKRTPGLCQDELAQLALTLAVCNAACGGLSACAKLGAATRRQHNTVKHSSMSITNTKHTFLLVPTGSSQRLQASLLKPYLN